MQKIDHKLFINALKTKGITQKAFANYAKIPYDTVTGWKKKGKVPAYAMVIAKDMVYRMQLDEQVRQQLQRRRKRERIEVIGLQPNKQKRIEAAFWSTNHTAGEIIKKVHNGDEKYIKQYNDNIYDHIHHQAKADRVKISKESQQ